jgi:hypothetical protein
MGSIVGPAFQRSPVEVNAEPITSLPPAQGVQKSAIRGTRRSCNPQHTLPGDYQLTVRLVARREALLGSRIALIDRPRNGPISRLAQFMFQQAQPKIAIKKNATLNDIR